MVVLNNNELYEIEGGINISGTLVKSISGLVDTIFNLGRNLGSSIRRIGSNKMCSL